MRRTGFKRYDYQTALDRLRAKRRGKKPVSRFGLSQKPLKRSNGRLKPGRKSKEWASERRKLKAESEREGRTTCELRGVIPHDCSYDNFLGYAHNAKRRKLTKEDLKTAILVCNNVHDKLEVMPPEEMKRIVNETIERRVA